MDGHEIKLAGETGVCFVGVSHLLTRARHGSRDGQTVSVESEIPPSTHLWRLSGVGDEQESDEQMPFTCTHDSLFWLRVVRTREVFANLADKSQAWCPQVKGIGRRPKSAGKLLCELRWNQV